MKYACSPERLSLLRSLPLNGNAFLISFFAVVRRKQFANDRLSSLGDFGDDVRTLGNKGYVVGEVRENAFN